MSTLANRLMALIVHQIENTKKHKAKKNCRNMSYLGKTQMSMKDKINIYKDPVEGLQYVLK